MREATPFPPNAMRWVATVHTEEGLPILWGTRVPTVYYDGVHHAPVGRFHMVDISTAVGTVTVPKPSALETSRREISEDVSFGVGTLLVVEQSSQENRPRGGWCYIHRRVYTAFVPG